MTIENLQIEVQATSEQAANSLERLEAVLKRIDALGNSTGFNKLYRKLKKLASLDFSGAEAGLDGIAKNVDKVSRALSRMGEFTHTMKNIQNATKATNEELSKFRQLATPSHGLLKPIVPMSYTRSQSGGSFQASFGGNIGDGSPNWTQWNPWGSKQMFDNMFDAWSRHDFGNVPTSHRLTDGTIELGADQWRELSKFESLFSNLKSRIRDVIRSLKDFGSTVDSTDRKPKEVNKTFGAIKTILMYSLLFSAISAVTKGVSEGLQYVAMYGEEANEVLTKYKTTTLELKNAIGSALVPVLQTLYPLIGICADALIDVANAVNVFFSALNGADSFRKAKKYTDDYAESLGKIKGMAGLDEIHTLGNTYDYGEMFETVELNTSSFVSATTHLLKVVSVLTILQKILTGSTWIGGLKNLKTLGTNIASVASKAPVLTKNFVGIGGLVFSFYDAKNAAYDLTEALNSDSSDGLGGALMRLVGDIGIGAAGGYMVGGPIGAVVGGLIALTGALIGAAEADTEFKTELLRTECYDVQGESISKLRETLQGYFNALDFNAQSEWIDMINDSEEAYSDALSTYNDLLAALTADNYTIDNEDIDQLRRSFEELALAAKELNATKIDALMSTIRMGIETNLTPDLEEHLEGLISKLREAKDLIAYEIEGLTAEQNRVLNEIYEAGGVATADQQAVLQAVRDRVTDFSISDQKEAVALELSIERMTSANINAGTGASEIIQNMKDVRSDLDNYIAVINERQATDVSTLQQLLAMDGGRIAEAVGLTQKDLENVKTYYDALKTETVDKYKKALASVYNTYDRQLQKLWRTDTSGMGLSEYNALKNMREELSDLLDDIGEIIQKPIAGYATGGFPEDGLFMANSGELVGKFTNGRTAVANNEQIIEGIKRGVKEANMETNGTGGDWVIQIVTPDGSIRAETIISAAERRNRRDGKTIIPLGI